jgi:hypothetical protein
MHAVLEAGLPVHSAVPAPSISVSLSLSLSVSLTHTHMRTYPRGLVWCPECSSNLRRGVNEGRNFCGPGEEK